MSEESDMDDSERMPLMEDRRQNHNRRRLIHWTRDFSVGTVALIVSWLVGLGVFYAGLSSDNAKRDERISTLQEARLQDRQQTNQTLQDIKNEIRETRNTVSSTKEDVAAVKAQLGVMQNNHPARNTR